MRTPGNVKLTALDRNHVVRSSVLSGKDSAWVSLPRFGVPGSVMAVLLVLHCWLWLIPGLAAEAEDASKADFLRRQLAELYQAGKHEEAIHIARQLLEIVEKTSGSEHPETANSLNNLAELYWATGDFANAEPLLQRALAIREKALGPEHPNTSTILNNLAELYTAMGEYAKAEALYERALAINEKALGPKHPNTVRSLNNLTRLYYSMGDYAKAEPLLRRGLASGQRAPASESESNVSAEGNWESSMAALPLFPWPPPKASASATIPNELLITKDQPANIGAIDDRLRVALYAAGYADISYYLIPSGFAMATRIERFEQEGRPNAGLERWEIEVKPLRTFSLFDYVRALFKARSGHFRVIVFAVTPVPFTKTDVTVSREEAMGWVYSGANRLPAAIRLAPYHPDTVCTALIYEFECVNGEASLNIPGRLTAMVHLEKSQILNHFQR